MYANAEVVNIEDIVQNLNPDDIHDYIEAVADILGNEEFLKTRLYRHHHHSILEHSLNVSYHSFALARKLKLDDLSTARGALLHDFFLYDWRMPHPEKGMNHGLQHPKTALRNSENQFVVNEIEKDIILSHMWPFATTVPKTKEALVVVYVDKKIATKEYVNAFQCSVRRSVLNRRQARKQAKF